MALDPLIGTLEGVGQSLACSSAFTSLTRNICIAHYIGCIVCDGFMLWTQCHLSVGQAVDLYGSLALVDEGSAVSISWVFPANDRRKILTEVEHR